ncbi:MAG: hypothetical protein IPH20_00825 [Bacteroidales bacterium]|nr:hypothetical protein [Bacteroidales bacterium]
MYFNSAFTYNNERQIRLPASKVVTFQISLSKFKVSKVSEFQSFRVSELQNYRVPLRFRLPLATLLVEREGVWG